MMAEPLFVIVVDNELEVEVEVPILEVEHPLAGSAQAAAGPPHRGGDEDSHIGIAAVDAVLGREEPAGGVGLARLDFVLFRPAGAGPS